MELTLDRVQAVRELTGENGKEQFVMLNKFEKKEKDHSDKVIFKKASPLRMCIRSDGSIVVSRRE